MQEHVLTGGHGLMVQGYHPVIKALAKDLDIRLNNRYALDLRKKPSPILVKMIGLIFAFLFFITIYFHCLPSYWILLHMSVYWSIDCNSL